MVLIGVVPAATPTKTGLCLSIAHYLFSRQTMPKCFRKMRISLSQISFKTGMSLKSFEETPVVMISVPSSNRMFQQKAVSAAEVLPLFSTFKSNFSVFSFVLGRLRRRPLKYLIEFLQFVVPISTNQYLLI